MTHQERCVLRWRICWSIQRFGLTLVPPAWKKVTTVRWLFFKIGRQLFRPCFRAMKSILNVWKCYIFADESCTGKVLRSSSRARFLLSERRSRRLFAGDPAVSSAAFTVRLAYSFSCSLSSVNASSPAPTSSPLGSCRQRRLRRILIQIRLRLLRRRERRRR